MKLSRTLQIAAATAVCVAATAQPALAGGEPKNTLPFTQPATGNRSPAAAGIFSGSAIASARAAIGGEPKNVEPFTRRFNNADALGRFLSQSSKSTTGERRGEPKNEAPFTLRAGHRA